MQPNWTEQPFQIVWNLTLQPMKAEGAFFHELQKLSQSLCTSSCHKKVVSDPICHTVFCYYKKPIYIYCIKPSPIISKSLIQARFVTLPFSPPLFSCGSCPLSLLSLIWHEWSDEVRDLVCNATTSEPCEEGVPASLIKGHGVMTGKCVPSDRYVVCNQGVTIAIYRVIYREGSADCG